MFVSVLWQPFLPFLFSQHCRTFFALCRFWSGDVRPADSEFLTSISGILKAEMFPAQVRALGLVCRMPSLMRYLVAQQST